MQLLWQAERQSNPLVVWNASAYLEEAHNPSHQYIQLLPLAGSFLGNLR